MLLASIAIYLGLSWLYRLHSDTIKSTDFAIFFFLISIFINTVTAEVLNLFSLLYSPISYLTVQIFISFLLGGIITGILLKTKKGILHFQSYSIFSNYKFPEYLITVIIGLILAALFVVGITTPPDNLDSLHTHLPRIYYWLQHGNLNYYPTMTMKQNTYPMVAHLQGLWLFLFSRNASLFFLVQWYSLLICTIIIFKLGKSFGFSSTQALIGSLVFLSFPVVLLQSYTFQGDLIVSALILIATYYIFMYIREGEYKYLVGHLLVLALAIGTKQTAFFVLPVFAILWLVIIQKRSIKLNQLFLVGVIFITGFL